MKKHAFNLMRPFSCRVFVYIFRMTSTSDRVQFRGLKTLLCTQSDALVLPKI